MSVEPIYRVGSNPSWCCKESRHKQCNGRHGTGAMRVNCTCRCHGPRGYVPPIGPERESK